MTKRRILASTYSSTPPEQKEKTPSLYHSVVANRATTRQRFIVPAVSAPGGVPGTATYTNWCAGCEAWRGVFPTVNTKDLVSRQALRPIGVLTSP